MNKQCDALRREAERHGDLAARLEEKEQTIREWMEEGEALSKKQAEMEGIIKRKNARIRELEAARAELGSRLEDEEAKEKALEDRGALRRRASRSERARVGGGGGADGEARAKLEAELAAAAVEAALQEQVDGLRAAMTPRGGAAAREKNARRKTRASSSVDARRARSDMRGSAATSESTRPLLRQIEAMRTRRRRRRRPRRPGGRFARAWRRRRRRQRRRVARGGGGGGGGGGRPDAAARTAAERHRAETTEGRARSTPT